MSIWATQEEIEQHFRSWTIGPLEQASLDAAHGLSRPERTVGTEQPVTCPDCGYANGRHAGVCQR